jgi:hypothetical protein
MGNNRREFLKMTAAGAVAAALPGYAQEPKSIDNRPNPGTDRAAAMARL